jgi:hypothetical protein
MVVEWISFPEPLNCMGARFTFVIANLNPPIPHGLSEVIPTFNGSSLKVRLSHYRKSECL